MYQKRGASTRLLSHLLSRAAALAGLVPAAAGGAAGSKELGEALLESETDLLVEMLKSIKADTKTLELQRIFFEDAAKPLETKQE